MGLAKHCVKIPIERSDLFVWDFKDGETLLITYDVRDKITGALLEPRRTSNFEILEKQIVFDGRYITLPLAVRIKACLG